MTVPRELSLPDGVYTITREAVAAVRAASGLPASDDAPPHAILASVATLAGSGIDIAGLLAVAGASVADGPMLGECRIELHGRLQYDVEYRIVRRVLSLERKQSRRLGAMDLFVFVASLLSLRGETVADVTYTWVLPKGQAA